VSVPLTGGDMGAPDDALVDFVWEELGVWPARAHGKPAEGDGEREEPADGDEDMEALAEAKHQGQLDRLAVTVSILRKRIAAGDAGPEYARARLEILRTQLRKLDVAAHIRRALLNYLGSPRRDRRRK
jgi:hypothetical protein